MRSLQSLKDYLERTTGLKAIKPDGIPSLEALASKGSLEHFDLISASNKISPHLEDNILKEITRYYTNDPLIGKSILAIRDFNGDYRRILIGEGKFTEWTSVTVYEDKVRITRNPIKQDFREPEKEIYFAT